MPENNQGSQTEELPPQPEDKYQRSAGEGAIDRSHMAEIKTELDLENRSMENAVVQQKKLRGHKKILVVGGIITTVIFVVAGVVVSIFSNVEKVADPTYTENVSYEVKDFNNDGKIDETDESIGAAKWDEYLQSDSELNFDGTKKESLPGDDTSGANDDAGDTDNEDLD